MRRVALALALALALLPTLAAAQEPLTLLRPLPVGASESGWDAANPLYRAYAGMPYVRTTDVLGGVPGYTYTLTSDSTGAMSIVAGPCSTIAISCTAGTITLSNPSVDFTYAVRVTDAVGTVVNSGTISVDVNTNVCDSIGGWCFVDADAGSGGDGSISSPYDTIADVWNSTNRADRIMVLRGATATYLVTGMTQTTPGDCINQVAWNEATRPTAWIGYPGESPIVDFDYNAGVSTSAPCMEFAGQSLWLQGFEARNFDSIGWQMNNRANAYGVYVGQMIFRDLQNGQDSQNSAFLEWSAGSNDSWGDTVTMNQFIGVRSNGAAPNGCALKLYYTRYTLIANNAFSQGEVVEAIVALKAQVIDAHVRLNTLDDVLVGVGGNQNLASSGVIEHNLATNCGTGSSEGCLTLGVAGSGFSIGAYLVRRNTFVGKVNIQNADTADGPWTFGANVIINSGGSGSPAVCTALRATCTTINDAATIVDSGTNLVGAAADGIVDGSGNLAGASRTTYLGTRGYELQASSATGPTRLRIRGEN